jgi:hypothetical protein
MLNYSAQRIPIGNDILGDVLIASIMEYFEQLVRFSAEVT